MKRIVIFGAGGFGVRYSNRILACGEDEIVCFLDNSKAKQGTQINGIDILAPEKINNLEYSVVAVVTPGFEDDIICQLKELGVEENKIIIPEFCAEGSAGIATRIVWLVDYAKTIYSRNIMGNVAEAGVFRGDFAKHINAVFPDKTLYLFDTFEGFPEQDVAREELPSNSKAGYYDATSEDLVLIKLPHPEKVIISKGYFPQTTEGVRDTFCFVNLDLDLYQPTLEGLKFFWDKMSECGVILVHDYFGVDFPNVKTAVMDFERMLGQSLKIVPIGDTLSIAIVK
jgi:hypothetical protein